MQFLRLTRHKIYLLLVCISTSWTLVHAQVNAVSPLTVFGLGDLSEGYFAQNVGNGGSSIAIREPFYVNIANPASYTALEYTTLEVAASYKIIKQTVKATQQELNNSNGYFNYMGLGFKLKDWWGMAASLAPYSFVGYNIFTTDSLQDFGNILYEFQGKGGINQLVLGSAFEPIKNLSIGVNARYLFGSWDRSDAVLFSTPGFYNSKRNTRNGVSSFTFDYGVQYTLPIGGSKEIILGANYATQTKLDAIQNAITYNYVFNSSGIEIPIDTLTFVSNVSGSITLPSRYGGGISLGKRNQNYLGYAWLVSGEYSTTKWSTFRDFSDEGGLNDSWRATIGGYFIPAYAFEGSKRAKTYPSIMEYRFGGFYENTQVQLNDKAVVNYGLTFGLGFPIVYRNLAPGEKKNTVINLGIVVGNKGNGQPDQLNERFVNFLLGITLNDQWFQKFKFR